MEPFKHGTEENFFFVCVCLMSHRSRTHHLCWRWRGPEDNPTRAFCGRDTHQLINMISHQLRVHSSILLKSVKCANQHHEVALVDQIRNRLGDSCSVKHCSPDSCLTSWWARRSGVSGRTAGTRRAGRCNAGAQYHGSAGYGVDRAARAHGEVCPCGRGPWRMACKPQSGTNAPADQCLEHWRNHQHRLWDRQSQSQDYCHSHVVLPDVSCEHRHNCAY